MKLVASFHPDAQQELIAIAEWYDDRRDGLGDEFVDAVSDKVVQIYSTPERFPIMHDDIPQPNPRHGTWVVHGRNLMEFRFPRVISTGRS